MATNPINSWSRFREAASSPDCRYLERLDLFPDPVLVAGCQRSGTTMLTRILSESDGMVKYFDGEDGELDGALILSGLAAHEPRGRYCFQTTYLDEKYGEYFTHQGRYRLIWLLRNPYSTVYSLLYNWPDRALYGTFHAGVLPSLKFMEKLRHSLAGKSHRRRIELACSIYNWKIRQIPLIGSGLKDSEFAVVDYDDLVLHKETVLPEIYRFIELAYKASYADKILPSSIHKKDKLTGSEARTVRDMCEPEYARMSDYVSITSGR